MFTSVCSYYSKINIHTHTDIIDKNNFKKTPDLKQFLKQKLSLLTYACTPTALFTTTIMLK